MQSLERPERSDRFRVFAVEYGRRDGMRGQHFHGLAGGWDEPHPTSYMMWLALSATRTLVIDAGIHPSRAGALPGLHYRGAPPDLLAELGVPPESVDTLVLTHLHYDHIGTLASFPAARLVLQRQELDYWSGPVARRIVREAWLGPGDDLAVVRAAVTRGVAGEGEGGCVLAEGDLEIAPGASVHLVGGHTAGMQVVSLETAAGRVVVASDAAHFYENLDDDRPFEILHDVPGMYAGFDRIHALADPPHLVVAGHDPEVFSRFPTLPEAPHVAVIA